MSGTISLQTLVARDRRVIVPEIADYEVRREFLRANKVRGLARLDGLTRLLEYLPLNRCYTAGRGVLGAGTSAGPADCR